jgi:sarcosine oxidase delta subunit
MEDQFKSPTGKPMPDSADDDVLGLPDHAKVIMQISLRMGISLTCHLAEQGCSAHLDPMMFKMFIGTCSLSILTRAVQESIEDIAEYSVTESRDFILIRANKAVNQLEKWLRNSGLGLNEGNINTFLASLRTTIESLSNEIIEQTQETLNNPAESNPGAQQELLDKLEAARNQGKSEGINNCECSNEGTSQG